MAYRLKPGYVERPDPEYWLDEAGETVWQPDVYPEAAELAARLGATRLIDIGCGNGEKLIAHRDRFELVGVDFGPNIRACREQHDFGDWIEADLESAGSLGAIDPRDSVVVCADVIEHMRAPERLLQNLRDLLERGALALLVTTPERDLRRGTQHSGPSPNPAHAREWSSSELRLFMADEGLAGHFGLTRTNDRDPYLHTILTVVPGAAIGDRAAELRDWWRYRARWESLARELEAFTPQRPPRLRARIHRRVRRLVQSGP